MTSSALFGGSARSSSKNLVEFRAGKMYMKGQMVWPDKRKGLLYLYQAMDDTLMHFCWKDRTTGTVEEDLIIFPDDCEFKRVTQCTTGRVYVLKFKSSSRRLFFWLQEPKTDKDEENARKINELLNNPPTPGSQRPAGSNQTSVLTTDISSLRESDIQNLFGNISQQQLMQILGPGMSSLATLLGPGSGGGSSGGRSSSSSSRQGGSETPRTPTATSAPTPPPADTPQQESGGAASGGTPATPASGSSNVPIHLQDLQNILSGIAVPQAPKVPVDLSPALTAEALQPILTNESFVEQLREFLPNTGQELPPVDQLKGTVSSPQFQQAVSMFSSALQSGQLGPLIHQFGLGTEAVMAATACDMEAFVKALGKKDGSKSEDKEASKEGKKDADKDEDDSMSVD